MSAAVALVIGLPDSVGFTDALRVAGTTGRLQMFDFRFDITEQYTFWSGTIAALFLYLSYFGTDQSQVQRYLSARSVDEARTSLLVSAYWKIPLQALVLLVGVLTFTFYLFTPPPMLFNAAHDAQIRASERSGEYAALQQRFDRAIDERRAAADQLAAATGAGDQAGRVGVGGAVQGGRGRREEDPRRSRRHRASRVGRASLQRRQLRVPDVRDDAAADWPGRASGVGHSRRRHVGFVGRAERAVDVDRDRHLSAPDRSRRQRSASASCTRVATAFWGLFASLVAIRAAELGSLIEVVNRFGSLFYGSILGVFVLAVGFKRANGTRRLHRHGGRHGDDRLRRHLHEGRLSLAQPDRHRRRR